LKIPSRRALNLLGFAACSAMMAFALFVEHFLHLMPCPLCVFQRMAVISMGVLFLIAGLHNPGKIGSRVYASLLTLAAAAGISVASRHVWLQNMPEDQVPACGPGFGYIMDSFPFSEALAMIFTGSGECADISWMFLGLSMPAWVLICFLIMAGAALWNNLRSV